MYAVTATITKAKNGVSNVMQIPTFYLDENVQGIRNEAHAIFIAEEIINPLRNKQIKVSVSVAKV